MFQPSSPIGANIAEYRRNASVVRAANEKWTQLMASSHVLGSSKELAPQIVMVSDFECPYCAGSVEAVDSAIAAGVQIRYVHSPAKLRVKARQAAAISECLVGIAPFELSYDTYLRGFGLVAT